MKGFRIAIIFFLVTSVSSIQGQFLKKLAQKAEEAAGRSVEKRVENETEKKTDESLDKIFQKKDKGPKYADGQSSSKDEINMTDYKIEGAGCSLFFNTIEDRTLVYYLYDKKDKLSTITKYSVANVTPDSMELTAVVTDEKNKEISSGTFDIECKDGITTLDPKFLMSPEMTDAYKDLELEVEGTGMAYPSILKTGQKLPDAEMKLKVFTSGVVIARSSFTATEREVIGKESVTTPAGTFDCFKLRYAIDLKFGIIKANYYNTEWVAENIGVVKDETRRVKNDKLMGRRVLQEIRD